jgi:hypothetical protein
MYSVVVRRCDIGIPLKGQGSSEGVMSVVFSGNYGDLSGGGIYRPFSYSTGSNSPLSGSIRPLYGSASRVSVLVSLGRQVRRLRVDTFEWERNLRNLQNDGNEVRNIYIGS